MEELLRRIAANGFAEIEGLQVTGTLPVRQDTVNDVVTTLLHHVQANGTAEESRLSGSAGAEVNWWKLVHKLDVQLAEGKLILDFELRR